VTAAAPVGAQHAGHLLVGTGFVLVALCAVALVEHLKARPRTAVRRRPARLGMLCVAAAGASAGGIHLAVVPSHWAQAQVYGAFFVLVGTTQVVWSLLLLVRPSRPLLGLTVAANLGVLLVWLQSRTIGLPLGPAAGRREPIGVLDLACGVIEAVGVVIAVRLILRHERASASPPPVGPTAAAERSRRHAALPAAR
jgi:hypothetical protein